jgi:hypothetical protein
MTGSRRMERKVGLAPCQARGDDWGRVRFGKTKAAEPTTALLSGTALTSAPNVPILFQCSLTAVGGTKYQRPPFQGTLTLGFIGHFVTQQGRGERLGETLV